MGCPSVPVLSVPASCIKLGLVIYFTYGNIYVSMLFSQINSPSPSPTETKSLFFASVSLSPSCILGHCYHLYKFYIYAFSSVQSLSHVQLCNPMNRSTPGLPVHHQLPEFTQTHVIESVMPSSHLILCRPLLLLPPIPPSIRVSSSESTLHMRWPKYWSFSFSISPSNGHPGLISFRSASIYCNCVFLSDLLHSV